MKYRITIIHKKGASVEEVSYTETKDSAKGAISTLNTLIEYIYTLKWNSLMNASSESIIIKKKVNDKWIIITEEQLDEDVSNEA